MSQLTDGLPNRFALAEEFGRLGLRHGAEIGVFKGQYSIVLCMNIPKIRLICVDTWDVSRNHRDPVKMERYYRETIDKLAHYDVTIMRMTSLEAAHHVADGSLDFVYIDALHDEKNVGDDLVAWVPKVRIGGVVSGHDWGHPGVTAALHKFLNGTEVLTTKPSEQDFYPSWYYVKHA